MLNPKKSFTNDTYSVRGCDPVFDRRLCFQAHDLFQDCMDAQNKEEPNKFECLNELYSYNAYCPPDFIKQRSFVNKQLAWDRKTWTKESLELINTQHNLS